MANYTSINKSRIFKRAWELHRFVHNSYAPWQIEQGYVNGSFAHSLKASWTEEKRLDRTARDIWKQVDKMEPKTPLGSVAKIAISVLAVPLHAIADEWIAGADMTETLGYHSPFHGPARELAS